jgi:hypothetical protein
MTETDRQQATWYAAARAAFGAVIVLAPGLLKPWLGEVARTPGGRTLGRAFGARDLAMGVGCYLALSDDDNKGAAKQWLQLCAASDAVDAAATLLAYRRLPKRGRFLTLATAAGGAYYGLSLASRA